MEIWNLNSGKSMTEISQFTDFHQAKEKAIANVLITFSSPIYDMPHIPVCPFCS